MSQALELLVPCRTKPHCGIRVSRHAATCDARAAPVQERWLEAGVEYAAPAGGASAESEDGEKPAADGVAGTQQGGKPTASESFELGIKRDYKVCCRIKCLWNFT